MSNRPIQDDHVSESPLRTSSAEIPQLMLSRPREDRSQRVVDPTSSIEPAQSEQSSHRFSNPRIRDASHLNQAQDCISSVQRPIFEKDTHTSSFKDTVEPTPYPSTSTGISSQNQAIGILAGARHAWNDLLFIRKTSAHHPTFLKFKQLLNNAQSTARKAILRIQEIPHSVDGRHIFINEVNLIDARTGAPYIHNSIRSSRYSLLNFFPRQLWAQFSKLANFYFLVIGIMQLIPQLSTTGRFTTIVPLLVFVGLSMAKEGLDDIRRWKLDQEENNRSAHVIELDDGLASNLPIEDKISTSPPSSWITKKWREIKVGDIVRLDRDDPVPADMILMYAEGGGAYMETMALDGETNLKNKQAPATLLKSCTSLEHLSSCYGEVVVEDPSKDLYRFEGKVSIRGESLPLTTTEVMYRGSTLRNTPTAAGIVCYTGEECRIRQNANKNPRIKAPSLQALLNKIVVLIASFVLVLSLACAFGYKAWDTHETKAWYLQRADVYWGYIVTSFIIMFNTLLPLSLYISMEIVKLWQIWLMNGDIDMYDSQVDTPMQCQTSTINEELGQISYVFSDKTGTLTKNEMKVKKLSCGGHIWNHNPVLASKSVMAKLGNVESLEVQSTAAGRNKCGTRTSRPSSCSIPTNLDISGEALSDVASASPQGNGLDDEACWDPEKQKTRSIVEYIYQKPLSPMTKKARFLILSIALCHTCLPEIKGDSDRIEFQATSPDELALVIAAQEMGYLVVHRQSSTITVKTYPKGYESDPSLETYEILHVIEFTSSRKRMSVIVREPDGRICVHCKGADTVIRTRLRLSDLAAVQVRSIGQRADERRHLEAEEVIRGSSGACSSGRPSFVTMRPDHRIGAATSPLGAGRYSTEIKSLEQEPSSMTMSSSPELQTPPAHLGNEIATDHFPTRDLRYHRSNDQVRVPATTACEAWDLNGVIEDGLVSNEEWVMEQTFAHVDLFANGGLRTLLHVARYISEEEYRTWAESYSEATTALNNRERRISDTADLIEQQFELVGATAIEDKLQDGVPDAIERLRRANIKLWMLTGDKRETAISISRSCQLAKDYSTFILLDHSSGNVLQQILDGLGEMRGGTVAHGILVLDGESLASIEGEVEQRGPFLELAVLVDSVICCRASPSQKAMLVKSVRHQVNGAITLAIGDGANDVAMIQEADVGIGISGGKEGQQAARTSDYTIAQFRFLCKLLLVHGRYNYDRIGKYILATTYKEMLFYMTQALYQRYNGYTGTSLYENWSLAWYNTFFTSLPVIFLGAFMCDLSAVTLLAVPELYTKGQRRGSFNFKIWLWWTFMASAEAMLVYFVMHGIYAETAFTLDNGLYAMGVLTYSACVILVNLKLQVVEVHNKTVLAVAAIVLSVGVWFAWNLMISAVYGDNVIYNVKSGFLDRFGENALWWLTLIVTVLSFLVFELAIKALKATFMPSDVDLFQVLEQDPVVRQRFESSAAPLLYSRGYKEAGYPDPERETSDGNGAHRAR